MDDPVWAKTIIDFLDGMVMTGRSFYIIHGLSIEGVSQVAHVARTVLS